MSSVAIEITSTDELTGEGVSPGVAAGPVVVIERDTGARGANASSDMESVLRNIAGRMSSAAAESDAPAPVRDMLRAQAMMVSDPELLKRIRSGLNAGKAANLAVHDALAPFLATISASTNNYLRQRAADISDLERIILSEMTRAPGGAPEIGPAHPSVLVVASISPYELLKMSRSNLLAIVSETGGASSHAAIVARELGIPAVMGVPGAMKRARQYGTAVVDGNNGIVRFTHAVESAGIHITSTVADKQKAFVPLRANIGAPEAAVVARDAGAEGIGLFRTEFMFMNAYGPMAEDQQCDIYVKVCAEMAEHPAVIRTLDAGADKPLPYLSQVMETNPQLGRRGVRLWLANSSVAVIQVRALLRAAAFCGNLRVMVPMVGARSEMEQVRDLFATEAAKLGVNVPPIGMMVELPAVAARLDDFNGVADFASIGTNDLTQYALGVDREGEWGEELSTLNPGVLQLIATTVETAKSIGMEVAVCGEFAGTQHGAIFLAGIGVDYLSMSAGFLPRVREVLRHLDEKICGDAAQIALQSRSAAEARKALSAVADV